MRLTAFIFLVPLLGFGQPFDGYEPPGTIHISGNLFIDATEVSNIEWSHFEHLVEQGNYAKYLPYIHPNQEVTKKYRPEYYTSPEYRFHPVVGIVRAQAIKYCEWKTTLTNSHLEKMYKHEALSNLYEVRFRLPSIQEWELAADLIDSLQKIAPGFYQIEEYLSKENNMNTQLLFNDKTMSQKKISRLIKLHRKNDSIPAFKVNFPRPEFSLPEDQLPSNVFYPLWKFDMATPPKSEYPLNLIGNVAELVRETGMVKGGSWRHDLSVSFPSKEIKIESNKAYDWVGFRCFCEVWEIR